MKKTVLFAAAALTAFALTARGSKETATETTAAAVQITAAAEDDTTAAAEEETTEAAEERDNSS